MSASAASRRNGIGVLALLLVTVVWGTTFPGVKLLSGELTAVQVIVARFAVASLVFLPLWPGLRRDEIRWGAVLGILLFIACFLQFAGLATTSSNRNAFVTGLNVILVPIFASLIGQRPGVRVALASLLALAGVYLLCWDGSGEVGWGEGETLTLASAAFYAFYIIALELLARRFPQGALRAGHLAATQALCMLLCGVLWMVWREPVTPAELLAKSSVHGLTLVYLGVIASAGMIWLQAWGQQRVRAVEAAILYALEPFFAAIAAWLWIGETMTGRAMVGGGLIIAGIVLSQLRWEAA
jgi:drug/metabolite transporter (DMT)-like permease